MSESPNPLALVELATEHPRRRRLAEGSVGSEYPPTRTVRSDFARSSPTGRTGRRGFRGQSRPPAEPPTGFDTATASQVSRPVPIHLKISQRVPPSPYLRRSGTPEWHPASLAWRWALRPTRGHLVLSWLLHATVNKILFSIGGARSAEHNAADQRRFDRPAACPTDTVLGSDGSGHGSGISDIAWDACGQSQSRAGSDRVPPAIRTTAHQCRHAADAAAAVDHRRGTRVVVDQGTAPNKHACLGLRFAN